MGKLSVGGLFADGLSLGGLSVERLFVDGLFVGEHRLCFLLSNGREYNLGRHWRYYWDLNIDELDEPWNCLFVCLGSEGISNCD